MSATETVIYNFSYTSPNDGAFPLGALVLGSDGNFYGTTSAGGTSDAGTFFRMTPSGSQIALHSFASVPSEGKWPEATLLLGSDGFFYGTTVVGGSTTEGTVFKISSTGVLSTLYTFGQFNGDGKLPSAGLGLGPDGKLYGVTDAGGTNDFGSVYSIDGTTGTYAQLHSFGGFFSADGQRPESGLVAGPDGSLYGTTFASGNGIPTGSGGTAYKISTSGDEAVLHAFGGCTDGAFPDAAMILGADGNFYGTTFGGGEHGPGTIFKLSPSGEETVLYSFGSIPDDGGFPAASLLQLADGSLLGTTTCGGPYVDPQDPKCFQHDSGGTAFMLSPDGTYTQLHAFGASPDGISPYAGLTQGPDGNFYGTTFKGGTFGADPRLHYGTVYKLVLNPSGTAPSTHYVPYVPATPPQNCPVPEPSSGGALDAWLGLPLLGIGLFRRPRRV